MRRRNNSPHRGCLFHLGQIIYRQVQKRGLQKTYGTDANFASLVRQITALAFLDQQEIVDAFIRLNEKFDERAKSLLDWFGVYYINGNDTSPPKFPSHIWSIADLTREGLPRTQNSLEAWHHRFGSITGNHHIGLIRCIEFFRNEQHHNSIIIEKLEAGVEMPVSNALIEREKRIEAVFYAKGHRDIMEFISSISHNLKFEVCVEDDVEEVDESEDNEY